MEIPECPLAGDHILQGMAMLGKDDKLPDKSDHPIELSKLLAQSGS